MYVCLYHLPEVASVGLLTREIKDKEVEELFKILDGSVHLLSNPLDLVDDPYFEKYTFTTNEKLFKQILEQQYR